MTRAICPACNEEGRIGAGGTVCTVCVRRVTQAVAETPARFDALASRLGGRKGSGVGFVSGSRDPRIKLDDRVVDARDTARNTVTTWVRVLLEDVDGLTPPLSDAIGAVCSWLVVHLPYLLAHEAVLEAVDELTYAWRLLGRLDDNPAERVYAGPCECGADVYATAGRNIARCTNRDCEAEYDLDGRRAWLEGQVADQLATAVEAARYATVVAGTPVAPATIRSWENRNRLVKHGVDDRGRSLFRVADVLDLAAGTAA